MSKHIFTGKYNPYAEPMPSRIEEFAVIGLWVACFALLFAGFIFITFGVA